MREMIPDPSAAKEKRKEKKRERKKETGREKLQSSSRASRG